MKKIRLLFLVALSFSLFSCSPTPLENNISFLDKQGAAFYYCGNESNVFNKIGSYYELSGTDFPESYPLISAFVIDVSNKSSVITKDFLNALFCTFYDDTYVYVMFININNDLSFLADSYFSYQWPDIGRDADADLLVCYKNGENDFTNKQSYTFSYTNESDASKNYHISIIDVYCSLVKNALLDQ